jgi:hypothetical protein
MTETKRCEQCQIEKAIECFYRRPQKNDPDKRIKICIDCYKANLAESKRQREEHQRQWQEEQQRRTAQQEAERIAREQEAHRRQARALELTLQANKRCPRCKQPRTDGHLFIGANGEERLYFHRYCQTCIDATSHIIYRLICPLLNQTRYIGITCQPLERRLAGHMRNESGTQSEYAWIETLRARGLVPLIEQIDTALNEEQAKRAEQFWIDHYLRLGCPLPTGCATRYLSG